MRFKSALLSLILLICPCALCYGQLSFSGINGERGYAALRGTYRWDTDRGFLLTPTYGYYRMSDKDIDEAGSTSRYGLEGLYEWNDSLWVGGRAFWQPKAVGYAAVGYAASVHWSPFYRWGILKNPLLVAQVGQQRYRSYVDEDGYDLETPFRQNETFALAEVSAELKNWHVGAAWHKVIKYSSRVPGDISFSWAEIPFMTAVIQGFIKEAAALRAGYHTDFMSPYAMLVRYRYTERSDEALAVGAGLRVKIGETHLTAGVEVFEPRREETRKTYFSVSAEVAF